MLQAAIDASQTHVTGEVTLKLYKTVDVSRGNHPIRFILTHVTFEEDAVYDQKDAEGFIRLNAVRLKLLARRNG